MRIIFISGDGHGAGKTYLAKKIASNKQQIFSIANTIRKELAIEYPNYDWYNKSPSFKDNTTLKENGKTIHQMLDDKGNEKKSVNNLYWAQQIVELLKYNRDSLKLDIAVIDDVRFVDEYQYIRKQFEHEHITHFHIINPSAKAEPMYENDELKALADYHLISKPVINSMKQK